MKKLSLLLCCCIIYAGTAFATHTIDGPFDEIRVSGKIDLVLESGNEDAVTFVSEEEKVNVEVREGMLVVKRKERWKYSSYKKSIKVVVTYKKLRKISADAGATVSSPETLVTADALRLSFGSGSSCDLALDTEDVELSAGEGSVIDLEGVAQEVSAKASTGGIIEAFDLKADRVYARANTGGVVEVSAETRIEASANTGGRIDFRGHPEQRNISEELGGRVESKGGM